MDFLLGNFNRNTRNNKRIVSTDYIIRKRGDLLHVCLNSPGCRYRNSGSCTMCDYGQGIRLTGRRMKNILPHIKMAAEGMQSVLIGTLGSVFDTTELSLECLAMICSTLNDLPIKTIIFETHYSLIDDMICQWLKKQLPQKDIVIEVGLESVDEFVQKKCLNKMVDLTVLKSKIELLHLYGISVTANVFLGAPFLSVKEQIEDTEKTINWAIDNEVDSIVIFPANIRKNTLLDILYKNAQYLPIQHWAIFEVLCNIPLHYLNRVYLAWYGDWIDFDETGKETNYPPYSCKNCKGKWMEFYHKFLSESDKLNRKKILQEYGKSLTLTCDCQKKFKNSLEEFSGESLKIRANRIRSWIMDQYRDTFR